MQGASGPYHEAMRSPVIEQLDRLGPEASSPPMGYAEASRYAHGLVRAQYENFSVLSRLLPGHLRDDFAHVYAFCRWADDLGDELGDPQRSRELLAWWREELGRCFAGQPSHPVFVALAATVERHDLPRQPFDDLIDAFVQDQDVQRYERLDQVLDYCQRSANPVGRLVLMMAGYRDAQRFALSDATCTALQLVNFWQDVRRDVLERDRIYIPGDVAGRHGLDLGLMAEAIRLDAASHAGQACRCGDLGPGPGIAALRPAYRRTIAELCGHTAGLFERGKALLPMLDSSIRPTVSLLGMGGARVLRRIEGQGFDTLTRRPHLRRWEKILLVGRAAAGKLLGGSFRPPAEAARAVSP